MSFQSAISSIKELTGVLRELAVVTSVVVIALYPGVLAHWAYLFNEESKKFGAKSTKVTLGPTEVAFENNTQQVAALSVATKATDEVKKLAQQERATAVSPQTAERAKAIERNADLIGSQLQTSIASAKTAQLAQDQVLQNAPDLAVGNGMYGIVVSADKQADLAAYEVEQLKKRKISDVAIYTRQEFLRTVARFPDGDAAGRALPLIQAYRKTAYVINLDRWCPNAKSSADKIAGAPVMACN